MADGVDEEYIKEPVEQVMHAQPFRAEVSAADFEQIERSKRNIETAKGIFDTYEERPAVASLLQELILAPTTPNEVKLEGFQSMLDLVTSQTERETNRVLMGQIIDTFRMHREPALRLRLAAMISKNADRTGYDAETPDEAFDDATYRAIDAKNLTLDRLAKNETSDPVYRRYAKMFLEQPPLIKLYTRLHDFGQDLTITPRIEEEITEETTTEGQPVPEAEAHIFTGNLVRLIPPYLPSLEKIQLYQERTGEALPFFVVRKADGKFVSVRFTPELCERAMHDLVLPNRRGELTKDEVFTRARALFDEEFLPKLAEDQRQEMEEAIAQENLEIRFSTERSAAIPKDNPLTSEEAN